MRKHKVCGASWPLKESHQTKLRQYITRDLRREKVVFRSSTEYTLQAHVLATTVSSLTTDGNGTGHSSGAGTHILCPPSKAERVLKTAGFIGSSQQQLCSLTFT